MAQRGTVRLPHAVAPIRMTTASGNPRLHLARCVVGIALRQPLHFHLHLHVHLHVNVCDDDLDRLSLALLRSTPFVSWLLRIFDHHCAPSDSLLRQLQKADCIRLRCTRESPSTNETAYRISSILYPSVDGDATDSLRIITPPRAHSPGHLSLTFEIETETDVCTTNGQTPTCGFTLLRLVTYTKIQ